MDLPCQRHDIGLFATKEVAALQYNEVANCLEGAHLNTEGEQLAPTVVFSANGNVETATSVCVGFQGAYLNEVRPT